jgi:hypothetical protein
VISHNYLIVSLIVIKSMIMVILRFLFGRILLLLRVTVLGIEYFSIDLGLLGLAKKVYGIVVKYLSFFELGELMDVVLQNVLRSSRQLRDFLTRGAAAQGEGGVNDAALVH